MTTAETNPLPASPQARLLAPLENIRHAIDMALVKKIIGPAPAKKPWGMP